MLISLFRQYIDVFAYIAQEMSKIDSEIIVSQTSHKAGEAIKKKRSYFAPNKN